VASDTVHVIVRTGFDKIAHTLRSRIASDVYPIGTRLPAVRELAAEFGVTTATVSRGLRLLVESGLVESRERSGVFVIRRPETGTAGTDSDRSGLIGFIAFDTVVSPYWSVVVNEIEQKVRAADYHLILGNSNLDVGQAIDYVQSFARARVDGIIFVPFDAQNRTTYESTNGQVIRELRATGVPYVLYDRTIDDPRSTPTTVGIDNEYYSKLLLRRLAAAGCRRPLAVSVSYSSSIAAREQVFMEMFPDAVGDGRLVRLPTRRVTEEHLGSIAEAVDRSDVDGLFLVNSSVLNGYLRACEAGLVKRLPDTTPFVAFEDFSVRGSERAYARALQAIRPLARTAADVCIDRIEHRGDTWGSVHLQVRLPCQLVPSAPDEPDEPDETVAVPLSKLSGNAQ
jgi:DNA-binding LacI/PurR family transcriptional regulator